MVLLITGRSRRHSYPAWSLDDPQIGMFNERILDAFICLTMERELELT
jgi:hypothetical protein